MASGKASVKTEGTGERRKCGRKKSSGSLPAVATEEELLGALSRIIRGELTEDSAVKLKGEDGETVEVIELRPSASTVMHCAELLGKYYGTFADKSAESAVPTVIFGEEALS